MTKTLILTHAAATLFLVGLIWTIQVVHYPLFAKVGGESAVAYQAGHQWRITVIVLPAMLIELACALLLVVWRPQGVSAEIALLGVALVGIIWASTFFLQVPQHTILDRGFDAAAHAALVSTNWVRTIAWTLRGALSIWMIAKLIPAQ